KYEQDPAIRKRSLPAIELFSLGLITVSLLQPICIALQTGAERSQTHTSGQFVQVLLPAV
ncbi:hypothetical protein QWA_18040, partial [Alcaligenes faecalis subsp. faecalis NCIB 8687]